VSDSVVHYSGISMPSCDVSLWTTLRELIGSSVQVHLLIYMITMMMVVVVVMVIAGC